MFVVQTPGPIDYTKNASKFRLEALAEKGGLRLVLLRRSRLSEIGEFNIGIFLRRVIIGCIIIRVVIAGILVVLAASVWFLRGLGRGQRRNGRCF